TDADGDPLVFQILTTEGGTATVDDAGTPTDAGDDRLSFTPADPPADAATVKYQALDPLGAFSNATLSVYVNPTAALPAGVQSESPTSPAPEGSGGGRCTTTTSTTVDDATTGPVGPDTAGATTAVTNGGSPSATTRRGATPSTTSKTSSKATTTTAKKSTNTTAGEGPGPTSPPSTSPPTTRRTTTTGPHTTSTSPPDCGPPANTDAYRECVRNHGQPPTTT